ncbi:MAG: MFS transporter [Eubacteriales bacterium]|nr:MFS transporter [Eubacteriales bacterium]
MKKSSQPRLLLVIVALFWFGQYVYFPYQTPYLLAFGVTSSVLGIVIGAYGFTQLIVRMPVGIIADKKPRQKFFILIGILAVGLASLIRIFLPSEIGFLTANLLSGVASSMWISFMVLYSNYFDKKSQQKAMGNVVASLNMGVLFGFLSASLLYDTMGMQILCIMSAASAAIAIVLALFISEPKVSFERLPVKKLVTVYADRRLILFSLLALIFMGITSATTLTFTIQLAKNLGANGLEVGLSSIAYITMSFLSSLFISTKFAVKYGSKIWIPAMMLLLAIYCAAAPNCPSIGFIYAVQALAGISNGILFSCYPAEAMQNVPPEKKSTAMGFFQAVYAIGITLMPIMAGVVADVSDINAAFYMMAIVMLAGFACTLFYYYVWQKKRLAG